MSHTVVHHRTLPADPGTSRLRPLALDDVSFDADGYWGAWQALNATEIIGHCHRWIERMGWIDNLRAAAEWRLPADRRGLLFTDSDVYKLIEAMSWEHGRTSDPRFDLAVRELTAIVAAAQDSDGYLNTNFGRPGQAPRYSDLAWGHELYNYGHLIQAAVARARTSGPDLLFDVAARVADHVCEVFGVGGIESVCGHPEIETALIEFARLTGDDRYREQAALFLERRGRGSLGDIEFGRAYFQDDEPIRDATVFRGHAVRALYLAAAAVDLAVDRGDDALLEAIEHQWEATIARRTYITGGMGSHHQDESFGADFELPNDRAYCETCAGVGSVMLNWRLLLATGNARYADQMERALHNIVATSPGRDGRSFFYANTLHQRIPGERPDPESQSRRASASQRSPWFEVSCCPTNVARLFATLGCYVATSDDSGVQLHLYTPGLVRVATDLGLVELTVSTRYPHDGLVSIAVTQTPSAPWTMSLRVPAWAVGAAVTVNGELHHGDLDAGVVRVQGPFVAGDVIELHLPFSPRFSFADERIDGARGAVAVERGPLVYCLESVDLPYGATIDDVVVDTTVPPSVIGGDVTVSARFGSLPSAEWAYGADSSSAEDAFTGSVRLEPYSEWGERSTGTMRVWIRRS